MSINDLTPDELISRFAEPPIATGLAKPPNVPPTMFTALDRDPEPFSVGTLDQLPLEIIEAVIRQLDFPSLARFSSVCASSHGIVARAPQITSLKNHARRVLTVLSKTGLLGYFTVQKLYSTLRSVECSHCGEIGSFVFLPTFERCCYLCLRQDTALWAASVDEVREVFGLNSEQLSALPVCHTLRTDLHPHEEKLVSVKQAKELAAQNDGPGDREVNMDAIPASITGAPTTILIEKCRARYRLLRAVSFDTDSSSRIPHAENNTDPELDYFQYRAAMCLPFFTAAGQVEHGLWCRGCNAHDYTRHTCYLKDDDSGISKFLLPDIDGCRLWREGLSLRAWTRNGFLEHVKDCEGVKTLPLEEEDSDEYDDSEEEEDSDQDGDSAEE